jgi:hypothetical protein
MFLPIKINRISWVKCSNASDLFNSLFFDHLAAGRKKLELVFFVRMP